MGKEPDSLDLDLLVNLLARRPELRDRIAVIFLREFLVNDLRAWLARSGLALPAYVDETGALTRAYGTGTLPRAIAIGPDQRVSVIRTGRDEVRDTDWENVLGLDGLGLRQQLLHDVPVHVGEAEVAALVLVGELRVVDAQQVQDRGLQVVDVDGAGGELVFGGLDRVAVVVGDVVAVVVGAAVGEAGLDAAAGQPDGEAARVVVAAVVGRR